MEVARDCDRSDPSWKICNHIMVRRPRGVSERPLQEDLKLYHATAQQRRLLLQTSFVETGPGE
jgi:hypothetical protein